MICSFLLPLFIKLYAITNIKISIKYATIDLYLRMKIRRSRMKRILLLGAGYGNIALIKSLSKEILKAAQFTLISQTPYHYISITLHEVISGAKDAEALFDIKEMIPSEVEFIEDSVIEIKQNVVICKCCEVEYDILIVGLGFNADNFGIKGVDKFSTPIVDYDLAIKLHQKLKHRILDYKNGDKNALNIVICGGGLSGIELVGSLVEQLPSLCNNEGVSPNAFSLTCIEAMPNILPIFNNNLINAGTKYLNSIGVKLEVGCKIIECVSDGVIVEKNNNMIKIDSGLTIWTAGVKGNIVIENSKFFTSTKSRIEVNNFLQPINQKNQAQMENIFIIGDCAALKDEVSGRLYAPTAQIAIREGAYLAKILSARILGYEFSEGFTYTSSGTICSIGRKYAIGLVGKKEVKGKIASTLKRIIEAKWLWNIDGLNGITKI